MRPYRLLITCEHGGNRLPAEYRHLFDGLEAVLASHRGWDPGTLALARWLGDRLRAPVIASTVTRLLVDLNRSEHNTRVFSGPTRPLPRPERERLLAAYHRPHWMEVGEAAARASREAGTLVHLGIHSFTPVLDGVTRRADVALLYDPARARERTLCMAWAEALRRRLPSRRVRRNYPYRGRSDGLTTTLRRALEEERYLGVEVEVSQAHVGPDGRFPSWVGEALADALEEVLQDVAEQQGR